MSLFLVFGLNGCKSPKTATKSTNNNDKSLNPRINAKSLSEKQEFDKYFFEGEKQKQINNYTIAVNNFLQALKIKPNDDAVMYGIASIYFNQNKIKDAEVLIANAYNINPTNKWYVLLYADILQNLKKYDKAAKLYEYLVSTYPEVDDYYLALTELFRNSGKSEDMMRTLDKMEKQFGKVEEVVMTRYKYFVLAKKYKEAIVEINKLIALNPNDIQYLKTLAQTYDAADMDKEAFDVYKKIDKISPGSGISYLGQAEYYIKKGSTDSVKILLSKAFKSNEITFDDKYQILVDLYFKSNVRDSLSMIEGIHLAQVIRENHPKEAKILSLLGDAYSKQDKNDSALYYYKEVLTSRKDIYELWATVLSLELVTKNYQDLINDSKKAIELYPNQPNLYFYRGLAEMELKNYDNSISTLTTGVGLVYNNNPLEASFNTNIAEANARLGKLDQAYLYYEKAIALDDKNYLALNNYAYSLVTNNKNIDKAEEMSKKTVLNEPENASYLDTYGWILFKQGKIKDAEKYISKALSIATTSPEVMEHYGDVLFKSGKQDLAITYWEKAIKAGSESKELERKIKEKRL